MGSSEHQRPRSRDNKSVKRRSRSPRDQSVNKDEERIVRYRSLSSSENTNSKNKRDKSEDDRVTRKRSEEGTDRDGVKQERSRERKDRNGSRRDRSEERKEK